MKLLLSLLLLTTIVTAADTGEVVLQRFMEKELKGAVTSTGEGTVVTVENAATSPKAMEILRIEAPKIDSKFYAVAGEVSYTGVEPAGFLEMWSHFAGGGAYFSRTLGESGPMGALRGNSYWREFQLPFNATGAAGPPLRLVVNVQLPGRGKVELRRLRLVQTVVPAAAAGVRPWWSDRTAGLIGGVAGGLVGSIGSLLEWLAAKGRARGMVRGCAFALIAFGAVAVGAGVAASFRQPYDVWYPLLLPGIVSVLIFPQRLRHYEERYRETELRRMSSLDAAAQA